MLGKEFISLVERGGMPVIEFDERILEREQDPDPGTRCRVLEVHYECEGVYRAVCDFSGYESYNKLFERNIWYNGERESNLKKWSETSFYPKDGIYHMYFDTEYDIFWKII